MSAPEIVTSAPAAIGSGEALIERVGWQTGTTGPRQQGIVGCPAIGGPQHLGTEAFSGQTTTSAECCRPDAEATFYVTPLARGWLRGERLEVLVNGRKVQELRLHGHVPVQFLPLGDQALLQLKLRLFVATEHRDREVTRRESRRRRVRRDAAAREKGGGKDKRQ